MTERKSVEWCKTKGVKCLRCDGNCVPKKVSVIEHQQTLDDRTKEIRTWLIQWGLGRDYLIIDFFIMDFDKRFPTEIQNSSGILNLRHSLRQEGE